MTSLARAPELVAGTAAAPADDAARRAALAQFLRSRRERIAPDEVGIVRTGRRRTPGLRREEVAQLAGVGVTWYTWLEQGRAINASEQVLGAIARTLQLTRDEQAHLFALAGAAVPTDMIACVLPSPPQQALLDHLDPWPACLYSSKYELVGYNESYRFLVQDIDAMPAENRNALWLVFVEPAWRRAVLDRRDYAEQMVANLRTMSAEHVGDPSWTALIARMRAASSEFAELWDRHEVRAITSKIKRYRNPDVGLLRFEVVNNWLSPRPGIRMVTYVPADTATQKRVATLQEMRADRCS